MAPTRRVTQADLARRAGVSRSCVSRVVRGLDKVSDDKRERILAAARELGYIDNGLATALAGNRRRRLVGFLPQEISNAVFGDVYDSLKAGLGSEGCQLVIVEGSFDPDDEDARLRELVSFAPDCIVVAGYAGSTDALAAAVHSIPIVSVTRRVDEDRVISVMGDDRAGAALAVEHLVGLGHERIAHLQLPPTIPYEGRAAGYTAAMEDAGLAPWLVTPRTQGRQDAREAVRALFATGDPPTGVFCGNDHMALGALEALHAAGLDVPGDVSVVGYDGQSASGPAGLTTVDQGVAEQGRIAAGFVRLLLGTAGAEKAAGLSHRVLTPVLAVRRTTAPPRR